MTANRINPLILLVVLAGCGLTAGVRAAPGEETGEGPEAAPVFQVDPTPRFAPPAAVSRAPPETLPAQLPAPQALWERLAGAEQAVRGLLQRSAGMEAVAAIFRLRCAVADPEAVRREAYLTAARELDEDPGLSIRGAYNYREERGGGAAVPDPGSFVDDNRTDQDGYLELSWELLGNGYRELEAESTIARHRAEITRLEGAQARHERNALCRRQALPEAFRAARVALLEEKRALVEPLHAASRAGYFGGGRPLEDVLAVEAERAAVAQARAALDQAGVAVTPSPVPGDRLPPLIRLDVGAVVEAMARDPGIGRAGVLAQQVAREQSRIKDLNRLRVFLRAEADDLHDSTELEMVAGLRFTVPLDRPDEPLLALRLREVEEQTRLAAWERQLELDEALRQYREHSERARRQEFRVLRAHERLRRSLATHRVYPAEADLYTALERALDLLDATLEAVASRTELYRRVNEVLRRSGVAFSERLVAVVEPRGLDYRARTGARSLYAWSEAFNALGNTVIRELLAAKGVAELLVSAGRATDQAKLRRLVASLREQGTAVSLVLANNRWARPGGHDEAVMRAEDAAALHPAVHLDVEPHTLPGFDAHREAYLADYVAMLARVRSALPDAVRITAAVPVSWAPAVYRRIAAHVDTLYLMAYGTADASRVAARVQPIVDIVGAERVVVVLRTGDFADERALETAFDAIAAATGVRRFGIHKLASYLRMAEGAP